MSVRVYIGPAYEPYHEDEEGWRQCRVEYRGPEENIEVGRIARACCVPPLPLNITKRGFGGGGTGIRSERGSIRVTFTYLRWRP